MHHSRRGSDPVFVDRTGRRRRLFAVAGAAGGLVLVLAFAALLAGFTGGGPVSVPGWPTDGHAGTTARPPAPQPGIFGTDPARPSAEPNVRVTPVAGTVTTASPPATAVSTTAAPNPGSPRRSPTHTPSPHASRTR